jgi:hypothetical protein
LIPLLLFLLAAPKPALAQNSSASNLGGLYPLQTYVGEHENINLATGNLNIRIPMVKMPGRNGDDLELTYSYNSKIWYIQSQQVIVGNPANNQYQTVYNWAATPPWSSGTPSLAFDTNQMVYNAGAGGTAPGSVFCSINFRVVMPDGAVHPFPNVQANCYQTTSNGTTPPAPNYDIPIGDTYL